MTRRAPDTDALLGWYERVRRPLPWRATRDPYALLVSEIMLQQTQAARVVPYYAAFLARFPTADVLAAAPVRDVLAAWSGLGYNRRAPALHAAARAVAATGWPEDLTSLPGVGPYTAAAVASFAWDRQEAAVDTNARRVIERHDGEARRPPALARRAAEWLPAGRAAAARFEDTDRWARGRIVAALVAGEALPSLPPARFEAAASGLVRDGLVVRGPSGSLRLP